jgi:hypothetical protein
MGQRSIQLNGLAGDDNLFFPCQVLDRAHIMETISKLDEHHPQVFRHREQQLHESFGLFGIPVLENPRNLSQAINQMRNCRIKIFLDIGKRDGGILDGIVKKSGCNRNIVDTYLFGYNDGNLNRMQVIRFTRRPCLPTVSQVTKFKSTFYQILVTIIERFPAHPEQVLQLQLLGSLQFKLIKIPANINFNIYFAHILR